MFLRPRCENCGNRLYRSHSPFRNYFWGVNPSHCPRCGHEISLDQRNQLKRHDGLLFILQCSISITILIVILIIIYVFSVIS